MFNESYWTTDTSDPAVKCAYWRSVLRESMYELDFEADRSSFSAELHQRKLGPLRINRVLISTGHEVTRSKNAIAQSRVASFHLNYVKRGSFSITQHGRTVVLQAGECVLIDGRKPYRVTSSEETEHICLHVPVDWLHTWMPYPDECLVYPIRKGMPWSDALMASLNDAQLCEDELGEVDRLCADQLAGTIALALRQKISKNSAHCRKLYMRFVSVLEEMASDSEISAQSVAYSLSVSPRYLYKILAREGTTYSKELIKIRLERAARMLTYRGFDSLSVAEVAWRNGFKDPSHFSKRFQQAYSISPGAYRRASGRAKDRDN